MTTERLEEAGSQLQALSDHHAASAHAPALAWGVMLDGRLTLSGSVGALDDGTAPTTATVFRIASMTKALTAATVLKLRDDEVLALDDPVPELRGFRVTTDSPPVTLRHLLSMQSGLTYDDPWADRHLDITTVEMDALLARGPAAAVPAGTAFEYSNLGYGVIGRVVARITGQPPQDVIERTLLRPLGLEGTTWTQPQHDDWARPYRVENAQAVAESPPLADGALAPMGGLWSTVDDVVRVMAFFDDAFPARDGNDDGPVRRASLREQQQVHRLDTVARSAAAGAGVDHVPERIDAAGYGFGMQVIHDHRFGPIVGHSGGLPGYGSNMRWLPGRRVGAVALANSTYAPMRTLTRRMLEVLDDHDLVPALVVPVSTDLQRAADALLALLNDWSDEAAADVFAANVPADESYARRAERAGELVRSGGRLTTQRIEALCATDGTIIARAGDGTEVRVWLALSPLGASRVQDYDVTVTPGGPG